MVHLLWNPRSKKKMNMEGAEGKKIPRGALYRDQDKDLTPDIIDCKPRDPTRQGERWDYIKDKFKRYTGGGSEEDKQKWHEQDVTQLQRKRELETERAGLQDVKYKQSRQRMSMQRERIGLQQQRVGLQERQQRSMGQFPSLFGQASFGGTIKQKQQQVPTGFMPGTGEQPRFSQPPRPKKRRKPKKKSSKGKIIHLRVG